jgi:hypothetical protein
MKKVLVVLGMMAMSCDQFSRNVAVLGSVYLSLSIQSFVVQIQTVILILLICSL